CAINSGDKSDCLALIGPDSNSLGVICRARIADIDIIVAVLEIETSVKAKSNVPATAFFTLQHLKTICRVVATTGIGLQGSKSGRRVIASIRIAVECKCPHGGVVIASVRSALKRRSPDTSVKIPRGVIVKGTRAVCRIGTAARVTVEA